MHAGSNTCHLQLEHGTPQSRHLATSDHYLPSKAPDGQRSEDAPAMRQQVQRSDDMSLDGAFEHLDAALEYAEYVCANSEGDQAGFDVVC